MNSGITVIGNTNLDIMVADTHQLPLPGTETVVSSITIRLGGSAGNLAVRCADLGLPVNLVSRVGDDSSLTLVEAELERPLLQRHLIRTPYATSGMTVAVESSGRDRSFISSLGAMAQMTPQDVPPSLLGNTFVALAGYFLLPGMRGPALVELFRDAKSAGARTVLDTGWPPNGWTAEVRAEVLHAMEEVDIFLPNIDELAGLAGHGDIERAACDFAVTTDTQVIVKMGALGAGLATREGNWTVSSAPPVQIVDSTGAGDGFNAAFLISLVHFKDEQRALASAVKYATKMVSTLPGERARVSLNDELDTGTQK